MRTHELNGIGDNALPKDRLVFLCADAQKRLDKFADFSYIACNQLPKKLEPFHKLRSVSLSEFNRLARCTEYKIPENIFFTK
jgi:hypothetical protein